MRDVISRASSEGSPASAWRVEVHSSPAPLEAAWRQLEATGRCTVFQAFDWAATWYATAAASGAAEPVIVTVSAPTGALLWLLPLCAYRKHGLRFISFADLGVSDYAAPLFAPEAALTGEKAAALARRVVDALPACDVVFLRKLPLEVEGAPNPLGGLPGGLRMRQSCYGIEVHRPWAELSKELVQPRLRSSLRQQWKRLHEAGPVTVETVDEPEALGPPLQALLAMRAARFRHLGRPDLAPEWLRFYAAVAGRHRGASVTTLRVSGEPIAACFGVTRGTAYHALLPTFATGRWERLQPGLLLFNAMLEAFGPKTDFRGYFDFTIGDEPYKRRLGGAQHPLFEWLAPRSAKGRLAALYWRVARRAAPGRAAARARDA